MHYATPALLATTLAAASLAPVQAQAPTAGTSNRIALMPRVSAGLVEGERTPVAAAAAVVVQAAAEPTPVPQPAPALQAAPLPPAPPPSPEASVAVPVPGKSVVPVQAQAPAPAMTPPPLAQAPSRAQPQARPQRSQRAAAPAAGGNGNALRPCSSVTVDPTTTLTLGKSQVVRLPFPVARLIVGGHPGGRAGRPVGADPTANQQPPGQRGQAAPPQSEEMFGVAETDVTLLSPTELFFLARRTGSMNVVLQANDGRCLVKDLVVTIDPGTLQAKLAELLPDEKGVQVRGAENALVLTGSVTDPVKLDQVLNLATSYGDGKKVVNMLRVTAPQQVMLEVKIAEVSKTLLDRFGLDFSRIVTSANGVRTSIISGIVGGSAGVAGTFHPNTAGGAISGAAIGSAATESAAAVASVGTTSRGASILGIDLQNRDGVVRVLAEPNIMAISGQTASFLSGGKIFIPVAQNRDLGGLTISLEEKEFGVGLKFTPTVLDGRINLKLQTEVSELSQSGTPFTTVGGFTAVLPSMSTRRVDTTVQLGDGQSFAVAGLIKSNFTEAVRKFPGLGEAPVVGALFRSTEFQNDQTELLFIVTPRLVKPLGGPVVLPTDNHVVPSRTDVMLKGAGEGPEPPQAPYDGPAPLTAPPPTAPAAPASPSAPATPPSAPPRPVSQVPIPLPVAPAPMSVPPVPVSAAPAPIAPPPVLQGPMAMYPSH